MNSITFMKNITLFTLLLGLVFLFPELKAQNKWEYEISSNMNNPPNSTSDRNTITIMTYNVHRQSYKKNGQLIKSVYPDIVSVQEINSIFWIPNFQNLYKKAGLEGSFLATINYITIFQYGIGLLYNPNTVGKPIITKHKIPTPKDKYDNNRGYIVAEFNEFYVIATHLSTNVDENEKMVMLILQEDCIVNYKKPVYIAGDLNPRSKDNGYETINAMEASGFEVLNNMTKNSENKYIDATTTYGGILDFILEYNQNPERAIIDRGVPANADRTFTISDHLPYCVTVKLK